MATLWMAFGADPVELTLTMLTVQPAFVDKKEVLAIARKRATKDSEIIALLDDDDFAEKLVAFMTRCKISTRNQIELMQGLMKEFDKNKKRRLKKHQHEENQNVDKGVS